MGKSLTWWSPAILRRHSPVRPSAPKRHAAVGPLVSSTSPRRFAGNVSVYRVPPPSAPPPQEGEAQFLGTKAPLLLPMFMTSLYSTAQPRAQTLYHKTENVSYACFISPVTFTMTAMKQTHQYHIHPRTGHEGPERGKGIALLFL